MSTDLVSGCLFPPGPPKWCPWPCQGHRIPAVTGYCNTALVPACVTTPSCRPTKHPKVKVNYPCNRSNPTPKIQKRYFPKEHKLLFDNLFNLFGFMCWNAIADLITTTDNVFRKLKDKSVLTPSFKKKPIRMLHLLNFWMFANGKTTQLFTRSLIYTEPNDYWNLINIQINVNYRFEIRDPIMNIQASYFCLQSFPVARFRDSNSWQILKQKKFWQ